MARLRALSGRAACEILAQHGFAEVRRRSSHVIMQKVESGSTVTVPVPDHKELRQINAYLDRFPNLPAVLVLYDATGTSKYTDPYGIKIAMYGLDRFVISMPSPYSIIDCGPVGHDVAVRSDKNRQLSALATLHKCFSIDTGERFLSLLFYHNPFAKHRIQPGWWTGNHIAHYVLGEKVQGEFQNWIKVA